MSVSDPAADVVELLAAVDAAGASAVVAARALASAGPSGGEALEAALGEAAANYCVTFEDWRLAANLPDSGIWPSDGSTQLHSPRGGENAFVVGKPLNRAECAQGVEITEGRRSPKSPKSSR